MSFCFSLILRDTLAKRVLSEVLRVADLDGRARNAPLRSRLVAREEGVDRRDLDAADDADVLLALPLGDVRGEAADQVAVLLRRVRQAFDVRDLAVERGTLHVVVGDRELRGRELPGDLLRRV